MAADRQPKRFLLFAGEIPGELDRSVEDTRRDSSSTTTALRGWTYRTEHVGLATGRPVERAGTPGAGHGGASEFPAHGCDGGGTCTRAWIFVVADHRLARPPVFSRHHRGSTASIGRRRRRRSDQGVPTSLFFTCTCMCRSHSIGQNSEGSGSAGDVRVRGGLDRERCD